MDFFDHQERARRHTRRLVFFYALAVVLIISLVVEVLCLGCLLAKKEAKFKERTR